MRRVLFLLILVIVFITIYGLNNLLADQHYILSGQPGEVLYTATFDAFLDDWQQYTGRLEARVEDGALHVVSDTAEGNPFSEASPYFGNFDLQVQAQAVAGPLDNGYGIIYRLQTKDSTVLDDDSYYSFLVSSDGHYQVLRGIDGDSQELSTWIPSDSVHKGVGADVEPNWLRVVAQGNRFQFYINGEQVQVCVPDDSDGSSTYYGECVGGQMLDTLTDDSVSGGQVGLIVLTLGEPGVEAVFDNLIITAPVEIE